VGRSPSELHLRCESARSTRSTGSAADSRDASQAAYEHVRVEKSRLGKPTAKQQEAGLKGRADHHRPQRAHHPSRVPEEAHRYTLGPKSAIEWIADRHQAKVDKTTRITNDRID